MYTRKGPHALRKRCTISAWVRKCRQKQWGAAVLLMAEDARCPASAARKSPWSRRARNGPARLRIAAGIYPTHCLDQMGWLGRGKQSRELTRWSGAEGSPALRAEPMSLTRVSRAWNRLNVCSYHPLDVCGVGQMHARIGEGPDCTSEVRLAMTAESAFGLTFAQSRKCLSGAPRSAGK